MKTPTTEHPILFSTPMVQAILEGRKTMTRRISKHQYWSFSELIDVNNNGITQKTDRSVSCKYGSVGDKLWVRETWCNLNKPGIDPEYVFKTETLDAEDYDPSEWKWKPSIHMPKAAARIWLEIVSIRVEHLQDISEADAIAEGVLLLETEEDVQVWGKAGWGVAQTLNHYKNYLKNADFSIHYAKDSFTTLWYEINGIQSWLDNPWVWVIEFKRINP